MFTTAGCNFILIPDQHRFCCTIRLSQGSVFVVFVLKFGLCFVFSVLCLQVLDQRLAAISVSVSVFLFSKIFGGFSCCCFVLLYDWCFVFCAYNVLCLQVLDQRLGAISLCCTIRLFGCPSFCCFVLLYVLCFVFCVYICFVQCLQVLDQRLGAISR